MKITAKQTKALRKMTPLWLLKKHRGEWDRTDCGDLRWHLSETKNGALLCQCFGRLDFLIVCAEYAITKDGKIYQPFLEA